MNPEIARLVSAAREGDRQAFTELVTLHQKVAGSVAYGILSDTHLAADAVQDAYVKAWRGLDGLREDAKFPSWFLQIVRSRSLDLLRHRKRKAPESVEIDENMDASDDLGPSEVLEQQERAAQIRRLLDELPSEYRELLLLKHDQKRSYREIARLLGTTVKGVESKLFRARQLLAEKLRLLDGGKGDDS
ncbi:MAG: sigma-70 family RNA polymerase sigma factor [Planctomycetota bacterium]|nr:sigma-70 family RNA polymerase sigma factor [Planctomycetota bacterium]